MAERKHSHSNNHALTRATGLTIVSDTAKGRGVFASQAIAKGTVIDVSPVLIFSEDEVEQHTRHTCLQHYTYYWPTPNGKSYTQAIALGLGSMFNHSARDQNVTWSRNVQAQCIVYTAHREIQVGEELCISYGGGRLWFKDADAPREDEYSMIAARRGGDCSQDLEMEISGLGGIDL